MGGFFEKTVMVVDLKVELYPCERGVIGDHSIVA